jgi:hypothetical protein
MHLAVDATHHVITTQIQTTMPTKKKKDGQCCLPSLLKTPSEILRKMNLTRRIIITSKFIAAAKPYRFKTIISRLHATLAQYKRQRKVIYDKKNKYNLQSGAGYLSK